MNGVYSAIRPTGQIHLGHYFGSIDVWKWHYQDRKNEGIENLQCFFSIADYHALTTEHDSAQLHENIYETLATYLACGVDPEQCTLFVQSTVAAHTELAWILASLAKVSTLNLMTQYKEKSKVQKKDVNVGLFTYPVLMAADILLYKTRIVPVGEDQKQHVEFTRELARQFNSQYGKVFIEPQAIPHKMAARLKSLDNPKAKMSKTGSPDGVINLLDTDKELEKKIKRAVTDSGKEVKYDLKKKPAISNLLTIFSLVTGEEIKDLETVYKGKGYGDFKTDLYNAVRAFITPIRTKILEYKNNTERLDKIIHDGQAKAEAVANETLARVKKAIGVSFK